MRLNNDRFRKVSVSENLDRQRFALDQTGIDQRLWRDGPDADHVTKLLRLTIEYSFRKTLVNPCFGTRRIRASGRLQIRLPVGSHHRTWLTSPYGLSPMFFHDQTLAHGLYASVVFWTPFAGPSSWKFIVAATSNRYPTLTIIPRTCGVSGRVTVCLNLPQPEATQN